MKQTAHRPGSSARRAFTLVEILVVVGVIALLTALAFPVFSRVRETGRRTSCTNNLRQLGLAFQQYLQDSSGRYPLSAALQVWNQDGHWIKGGDQTGPQSYDGVTPTTGFGLAHPSTFEYVDGRRAWVERGAIFPYIKSTQTYICPSARDNEKKLLSYSMNCAIGGLNSIRIKQPSEIILLVDEGDTINDGYFWATKDTASTDAFFKGHNGGGNLLMADGSVQFFTFDQFPVNQATESAKPVAQRLKWRGQGNPRFHDRAFGPQGSHVYSGDTEDTCNVAISPARDWTAEP